MMGKDIITFAKNIVAGSTIRKQKNGSIVACGNILESRMEKLIEMLEKALTPPTEEEVCKALSEYLKPGYTRSVKVTFEDNEFVLFDRRIVQYVSGNIWFNLPFDFPPHLITMISRFYEGKVK